MTKANAKKRKTPPERAEEEQMRCTKCNRTGHRDGRAGKCPQNKRNKDRQGQKQSASKKRKKNHCANCGKFGHASYASERCHLHAQFVSGSEDSDMADSDTEDQGYPEDPDAGYVPPPREKKEEKPDKPGKKTYTKYGGTIVRGFNGFGKIKELKPYGEQTVRGMTLSQYQPHPLSHLVFV